MTGFDFISIYTYTMLAIAAIMMPWTIVWSPKIYLWLCTRYSTRAGQIFHTCDNVAFNIATLAMWLLLSMNLGSALQGHV